MQLLLFFDKSIWEMEGVSILTRYLVRIFAAHDVFHMVNLSNLELLLSLLSQSFVIALVPFFILHLVMLCYGGRFRARKKRVQGFAFAIYYICTFGLMMTIYACIAFVFRKIPQIVNAIDLASLLAITLYGTFIAGVWMKAFRVSYWSGYALLFMIFIASLLLTFLSGIASSELHAEIGKNIGGIFY